MIQVRKAGHAVPKILLTRGAAETVRLQAAYDAGVRDFTLQKSIYGGKAVKSALVKIQHKKCVFCEAKITATSHGDVEHYRPKGGFVQGDGDTLTSHTAPEELTVRRKRTPLDKSPGGAYRPLTTVRSSGAHARGDVFY